MTLKQRREAQQRSRRQWYRFFRFLTICIFLFVALIGGFVGGLFASVSRVLPSNEALADIHPPAPTRILASDGSLLGKVYSENREIVTLKQMGKYLPNATVAIEDIRFFKHPGVDPRGIARALFKNIATGNSKEGASTITQQLARNLYLTREKKITRKLQEVVLALQLERRYSKEEILETYLNQTYYGTNRYSVNSFGVQVAAQNYFGKDVSKLTLAEAALLAGLPKNPRDYNPYRYPKAAQKRRDQVLFNMWDNGFISKEMYEEARQEPIKLAKEHKLQVIGDSHAPYFTTYVLRNELKRIFGQDRDRMVYRYGIDVYTTLDPRMQKVAETAITTAVERNRSRRIDDGALIAIDPQTGFIKAMVGGKDFHTDEFNIVTQGRRQPGSAFKPFVYTTALLHGYTPTTRVYDRAVGYPSGSGGRWSPKNSDGQYHGAMQLQQALWQSRNAVAVNVAADLGIDKVIAIAHQMGVKTELDPYLPTAIGASVVSPLEICSAYGDLANHGIRHEPSCIARITTPEGEVLYENEPQSTRVLPTQIADTMKEMMRGVIERGTARAAMRGLPFKASGKTGTTNSFKDAWFIGYTDDVVAAVWVGNRHNQSMNRTFGATVPAPIWKEFMLVAQPIMVDEHHKMESELASINSLPELTNVDMRPTPYIIKHGGEYLRTREDQQVETAPEPPPPVTEGQRSVVMVCAKSKMKATPWCPDVIAVTYVSGRPPYPPTRTCTLHTSPSVVPSSRDDSREGVSAQGVVISVCAETGKIATSKCPTILRRRFQPEDAPTETCPLHGGD